MSYSILKRAVGEWCSSLPPLLREVELVLNDIDGAPLDLFVNSSDIFAQDSDRQELYSPQEKADYHKRGPTGHVDIKEQPPENHDDGKEERGQRDNPAHNGGEV